MSTESHQTVRLSRGRHRGPEQGVCVMELASMLAGERFTDRPRSVCPVIAAFLRTYNDGVDGEHRRDLYRFAALSVDTRGSDAVALARGDICRRWARAWYPELRRGRWRLVPVPWPPPDLVEGAPTVGALAGLIAAKLVRRHHPAAHGSALGLLERLIECAPAPAIGVPMARAAVADSAAPNSEQIAAPARYAGDAPAHRQARRDPAWRGQAGRPRRSSASARQGPEPRAADATGAVTGAGAPARPTDPITGE